ncbi:MAG: hypothetical protein AAF449_25435 [Myxococcota bacterium]
MQGSRKTLEPASTWGSSAARASTIAVWLSLAACVQVRGCGDAGRWPIVDVQIVNEAARRKDAAADVSDDDIKPSILRMMSGWSDFAFRQARPSETGWQLIVRIAQITERSTNTDPKQKARSVGVVLQLKPLGEATNESDRYAAEFLERREEAADASFVGAVEAAIAGAGDRLMRFRALYRGDDDAVRAALAASEETTRIVAINIAAERRLRSAVPELIERVRDPKESGAVVVRAVGALVSLSATEATEAIIGTARRQDRAYIVPLLFALGQLGGRQAQAYLFTVQSGHPDPAVKAAAGRALEELEQRLSSQPDEP